MKLCILIDGISNSGGTDRVASLISSLFTKHNFETSIYTLSKGTPFYKFDEKVEIVYPESNLRYKNLVRFCSLIKKKKFDFVIVLSMGKLSAQAIPLLKLYNVKSKIICNDHVSFKSFSKLKRFIKWPAYKLSDSIAVLTEADRVFLAEKLGEKVKVVRNCSPYENATLTIEQVRAKEKIVLAVGRLTYQKNFLRLLECWRKVNKEDWELVIVGKGEELQELNNFIINNKINNASIVAPTQSLDEWYKKASLLVMTSRYEGLPMVLIESKNFGIPSVAFNCETGPIEIIKDDGVIIEYNKDSEFVRTVDELLSNNSLRETLSVNALRNSKIFSAEEVYKEWISAIM